MSKAFFASQLAAELSRLEEEGVGAGPFRDLLENAVISAIGNIGEATLADVELIVSHMVRLGMARSAEPAVRYLFSRGEERARERGCEEVLESILATVIRSADRPDGRFAAALREIDAEDAGRKVKRSPAKAEIRPARAEITAEAVKTLRMNSGAGMMDCKKALVEANGSLVGALDWLRAKGLVFAASKRPQFLSEGLVGVETSGTKGAVVEINTKTDLLAKTEMFQSLVRSVVSIALALGDDLAAIKQAHVGDKTVDEALTYSIATMGENQEIRRARYLEVPVGLVAQYVHNHIAPGLGKIGVLVALESEADAGALEPLGRQLAMHIAAAFPLALDEEDIDPEVIEAERAIAQDKLAEHKMTVEEIATAVEASIFKFRRENALLSQFFVLDGRTRISDVIAAAEKSVGKSIKLVDFVRFQLGEGVRSEDGMAADGVAPESLAAPQREAS